MWRKDWYEIIYSWVYIKIITRFTWKLSQHQAQLMLVFHVKCEAATLPFLLVWKLVAGT